jgi:hypothetical protein
MICWLDPMSEVLPRLDAATCLGVAIIRGMVVPGWRVSRDTPAHKTGSSLDSGPLRSILSLVTAGR